jgi:hypothetical protein
MVDSLGFRFKFGVIAPSTNTSVQPEFDAMRPYGVTNHFSRIHIPDMKVANDRDFENLVKAIADAQEVAIDSVMTCHPQHVIMGMSGETFWDGADGAEKLLKRMEERAGVKVTMGSHACWEALKTLGNIKRIAVITPYMPVGATPFSKSMATMWTPSSRRERTWRLPTLPPWRSSCWASPSSPSTRRSTGTPCAVTASTIASRDSVSCSNATRRTFSYTHCKRNTHG